MVKRGTAATIVAGFAGLMALSSAAIAGMRYDPVCNCRRADSQFTTRTIVHEQPRVITRTRVVNTTRVVPRVRVVHENRVVVHIRKVEVKAARRSYQKKTIAPYVFPK